MARARATAFEIDDTIVAARFYDLAKNKVSLDPRRDYDASIGAHKITFRIDPEATSGPDAGGQPSAALSIAPSALGRPWMPFACARQQ